MSVPSSSTHSMGFKVIMPIEQKQGTLYTPKGSYQVSRQDNRFYKHLLKNIWRFSAVNLVIAGSIVGYSMYVKNAAIGWSSTPFFANSITGLFGFIFARNVFLPPVNSEETTSI